MEKENLEVNSLFGLENRDGRVAVSYSPRPASGRDGGEILSSGAVAVHRPVSRFPHLVTYHIFLTLQIQLHKSDTLYKLI